MDWSTLLTAAGILFGVILSSIISYRVAAGAAKKSDMELIRSEYQKLQVTYSEENTRLNNVLTAEQNARRADKLSCQEQINALQSQLTALLGKLPEPGAVQHVKIVAADMTLPVAIANPVPVPVELVRPIPLPMTAAQQAQAIEAASVVAADKGDKL